MNEQWQNSRAIVERVYIRGTLALETPAHFGNGDASGLTDIPLVRDEVAGVPLLTGTSIAGALRNYLRELEKGYGATESGNGATCAEKLFGFLSDDKASVQSWLIVEDALGTDAGIELRDGVALDFESRTAEDEKKFDIELFAAGTMFDLGFELLLTADNQDLLASLVAALEGFERGEIGLGQRKRRGLGQCRVNDWRVWRYAVTTPNGLIGWLNHNGQTGGQAVRELRSFFGAPRIVDVRTMMRFDITCTLDGAILIRSGAGIGEGADTVHLKSKRVGGDVPVLTGTSIAGAIRARATRIANTLKLKRSDAFIDDLFGKRITPDEDEPTGSRVTVRESEIQSPLDPERVQNRVKIDRFTGGAYPSALFSEQPSFGKPGTTVKIELAVRNPKPSEIGLLLLVLKDVWTGDLAFGGTSGIGRGRLTGINANLTYAGKAWTFARDSDKVIVSGAPRAELESFVNALKEER